MGSGLATGIKKHDLKKERRAAELIGDQLLAALRDKDQFRRYIVTEKKGSGTETVEYLFDKVDAKAAGEMIRAVKALEELKASLYGEEAAQDEQSEALRNLVILPMAAGDEDA